MLHESEMILGNYKTLHKEVVSWSNTEFQKNSEKEPVIYFHFKLQDGHFGSRFVDF